MLFGMLVTVAAPAGAQQRWHPEIGVQGGYARVKPAGTGQFGGRTELNYSMFAKNADIPTHPST
jgi:hypothetical protein